MGSVSLFIFFITLLVLARQVSKLTVAATMTSIKLTTEQLYIIITLCIFTLLSYLVLLKNRCMRRFLLMTLDTSAVNCHSSPELNLEASESMFQDSVQCAHRSKRLFRGTFLQ